MHLRRIAAAVVAAAVAGCGSDDHRRSEPAATSTPTAAATQDTDSNRERESGGAKLDCREVGDLEGKPKLALPKGLPLVAGAHVYESQGPFGKTTRYFAVAKGGPEDLPNVRDKVDAALRAAGYKLLDADQEEGAEAEGHLTGRHAVDVQVIDLCRGRVRMRYAVS